EQLGEAALDRLIGGEDVGGVGVGRDRHLVSLDQGAEGGGRGRAAGRAGEDGVGSLVVVEGRHLVGRGGEGHILGGGAEVDPTARVRRGEHRRAGESGGGRQRADADFPVGA